MRKRILIVLLSFLAVTASITLFAHNTVVVIPLGSDQPAPTSKTIFYTNDSVASGDFGGVDGGDSFCQIAADNASVEGNFKAWLGVSGSTEEPPRPGFKTFDLPYRNVDGSLVATGFADFTNGLTEGNIIKSETGVDAFRNYWTAISSSITYVAPGCNNWTSSSSEFKGTVGNSLHIDNPGHWTAFNAVGCNVSSVALLCFEQ